MRPTSCRDPFFVLATQNPIELEGTYPLPEAQLDRFLFKLDVPGLDADTTGARILTLGGAAGNRRRSMPRSRQESSRELFELSSTVFLPQAVAATSRGMVAATHPNVDAHAGLRAEHATVRYGASPRAAIAIAEAARRRPRCSPAGRTSTSATSKRVAVPALAHRLVLRHAAQGRRATTPRAVVVASARGS